MSGKPVTETRSVCSYCGVGCGVVIHSRGGRVIGVTGDKLHPANYGELCSKGRELHETVHLPNRLLYPQMRASKLQERARVSWDAALARITDAIKSAVSLKGPDSVAFYISGQLLTEDYYVFNKLAKGFIGTNNIDSNSRLCMSSAVAGYGRAFGVDGPPACYDDVEHADLFFVVGGNPAWCHPVLFRRMERRFSLPPDERPRMIVLDPRRTATAELADLHVPLKIGSDGVFVTALLAELYRRGRMDGAYIREHTEGFEILAGQLAAFDVRRVETECGISPVIFEQVVRIWSESRSALSLWTMGVNQSTHGTDTVNAITNLHLATGHIGRPGAGPFSLTGQPNAMGGREAGAMANLLPGHRSLANPADLREMERFWDSGPISPQRGLTAVEMFEKAADGALDVLWIACTNPAVSMPNLPSVRRALERTPLLIVQDIVGTTDTAKYADILLPAAGWAEKSGTMTNSERRLSRLRAAVPPPGECRPDWEIVCDVAARLGHGQAFGFRSSDEILDEHIALTAGRDCDMTGITPGRLERGPVQWPCAGGEAEGRKRLYADGIFPTPTGRARFVVPERFELGELPSDDFPVSLTTGRCRDQWHTMTRTGRVPELNLHAPEPVLEISPDEAVRVGIRTGDLAFVESRRGRFTARTEIVTGLPAGTAFSSMHWGGEFAGSAAANEVTIPAFDPVSFQPELKHAAVRIRKFRPEGSGRVVIVGMGVAGMAVAQRLRELQPERPIVMIGDEPRLYYNRVRLHEVLAGRVAGDDLTVHPAEWFKGRNIQILTGERAELIDVTSRKVRLSRGGLVPYDQLVIATGAIPKRPPVPGNTKIGVHTIRSLGDIVRVRDQVQPGSRAWVIGAGPLGLEIAAALKDARADVAVAAQSRWPLRGRVDEVASYFLIDALADAGISFHADVVLEEIYGNGRATGLKFTNGRQFDADLVIFAAGISGDNRLAETAQLKTASRIVVNSRMETSVPGIYAVGEAAEFEGESVGLVPVARAQGETAAAVLSGDPSARYQPEAQVLALKFPGLELRSVGRVAADPGNSEEEEIIYLDRRQCRYRKIVLSRDRIAGILAVGAFEGFMDLDRRFRQGLRIGLDRDLLLSSAQGRVAKPSDGPTVCSCCSITAGQIISAIAGGAASVSEIGKSTGAGTKCGSCRPELQALIRRAAEVIGSTTDSGIKSGLACPEERQRRGGQS